MDKTISIAQLVIAAVVFLCAITGTISHIITGHVSIIGSLACLAFAYLSWVLLRISYREMREEK